MVWLGIWNWEPMMSLPHEQIELAETTDLDTVQSFYAGVGYGCEVCPGDRFLVSWMEQSIVAAARLCTEGATLVLRGMYVAEGRRGQGIGSRLLESISDAIGSSECWCVPYAHLRDFYSRIGFSECSPESSPGFLGERLHRYRKLGHQVIIMKRAIEPSHGDRPD
jgi:GNAT superfamily N-acetyltransferase